VKKKRKASRERFARNGELGIFDAWEHDDQLPGKSETVQKEEGG